MRNSYPGKFIVFEGIDGSGKSTQLALLVKHLDKEGCNFAIIDFPQYGKKSAGLIEEYLNGKYGNSQEVGPYRASIFYACDRYDASSKIRKWLKEGKFVISDRYFASNIGHQGGKIKNKNERKNFLKWLYNLEFNIFGIPKPDLNFILKVPSEMAQKLIGKIKNKKKKAKRKLYLGNKKRDIHEKDINHLINTEESYSEAVKEFPSDFKVIECVEKGRLLPPELIHDKIWKIVKKLFKVMT